MQQPQQCGRPPRSDQAADKRVTVYLTSSEKKLLKALAGDTPLAQYIRIELFGKEKIAA